MVTFALASRRVAALMRGVLLLFSPFQPPPEAVAVGRAAELEHPRTASLRQVVDPRACDALALAATDVEVLVGPGLGEVGAWIFVCELDAASDADASQLQGLTARCQHVGVTVSVGHNPSLGEDSHNLPPFPSMLCFPSGPELQ